jgi:hypothetical protein
MNFSFRWSKYPSPVYKDEARYAILSGLIDEAKQGVAAAKAAKNGRLRKKTEGLLEEHSKERRELEYWFDPAEVVASVLAAFDFGSQLEQYREKIAVKLVQGYADDVASLAIEMGVLQCIARDTGWLQARVTSGAQISDALDALVSELEKAVLHAARYPARSSSPLSNLLEQEHAAFAAEILSELRSFYLNEIKEEFVARFPKPEEAEEFEAAKKLAEVRWAAEGQKPAQE